jgi:uncharacterized protein YdaU (DUF1376 family)
MKEYKFYVEAYRKNTAHLQDADDLALRRMLDICYLTEKPLPLDIDEIVDLVKLDRDIVEPVVTEFFYLAEDGWHNLGAEKQIEKWQKIRDKNRRNIANRWKSVANKPE